MVDCLAFLPYNTYMEIKFALWEVYYMTIEATQRIAEAAKDLPDENEQLVINYIFTLKEDTYKSEKKPRRLGVGEGKFKAPEDFDENNDETH